MYISTPRLNFDSTHALFTNLKDRARNRLALRWVICVIQRTAQHLTNRTGIGLFLRWFDWEDLVKL